MWVSARVLGFRALTPIPKAHVALGVQGFRIRILGFRV